MTAAEQLLAEAEAVHESIRDHKRQIKQHRRQVLRLTAKQEELRRQLAEYGIGLEIVKAQSKGGHST